MSVRVGVNGFGRIGRLVVRAALKLGADVEFVGINDLADAATLAHLFKYDSVHGVFDGEVAVENDALVIAGRRVRFLLNNEPSGAERTVFWDGRDDNGKICRMGIYILLLEARDNAAGARVTCRATVVLAGRL